MLNNKNQGRGRMPDGIAPPIKSRQQIRWEFVESIRELRNALRRGASGGKNLDEWIDRIMEQALSGMALNYANGWRDGRAS